MVIYSRHKSKPGGPKKYSVTRKGRPIKPLTEDDFKNYKAVPSDLMNAKELAKYLKLSPYTVYRKAKAGEIPCIRIGKLVKFSKADIDMWILNLIYKGKK